ncbi:hypothetical protein OROHE_000337 [Orobanche hederae]
MYNVFWLPLLANHSESRLLEGPLVVPLDCEWIWHCHRLNPVRYKSDCDEFYGKILDNQNVVSSYSFPYDLPPNLTNLNLAENKLGPSITYSFEKMKHLRNLGHNFLTGPLDDVLHGLENLKLIASNLIRIFDKPHRFFQNNQFTGSVIFLANLSLFTCVDFTLMSVHDSPHMSAFNSSPMIISSRLPPIRAKTLKVSRRKSFSKSKTVIGAKTYTVAELQIATNNFSEENLIGEGSLGSVYRAEFPDGTGFDYIIRGCRACGLGCNFQFQRLMESMRFIGAEICYLAKYYLTIAKLFAARADLYGTVYTHAKVKINWRNLGISLTKILFTHSKNGGVSLREEDVMVNNVRPDLTCGRHSLLVYVFETPFSYPPFDFLQLPTSPILVQLDSGSVSISG